MEYVKTSYDGAVYVRSADKTANKSVAFSLTFIVSQLGQSTSQVRHILFTKTFMLNKISNNINN